VDVTKITLPGLKTKAEEAHEITGCIDGSMHVTNRIQISYLSNLDKDNSEEQPDCCLGGRFCCHYAIFSTHGDKGQILWCKEAK
jgi:hypothetical protein